MVQWEFLKWCDPILMYISGFLYMLKNNILVHLDDGLDDL
jgi:hypothetical protein